MIAKALCIIMASYSYAMMLLPPKSARSVWTSKTDKIKKEASFSTTPYYPYTMTALTSLWAALYLVLMIWPAVVKPESRQLRELKTWQVAMTILSVASYLLRTWSFRTLDWFFTYQLTIRPGHRLVTSGPYKILRHPSYTGFFFNGAAVWTLLWHNDISSLLPVLTYSNMMGWLGVNGGLLVAAGLSWMTAMQIMWRVAAEEEMLKGHFGKEWDIYSSKRWRFIPYIY
ncbi:hypothetical protein BKA57DRAFT_415307 [Linnemannia elongata]|nr:hypothetical protein BKA57DRAFT_415307 [Linnemannia elongata]